VEVSAKHLLPIESADKLSNKVGSNNLATLGATKARFHRVANYSMDINNSAVRHGRLKLQNSTI
jgi:hypothetical protein